MAAGNATHLATRIHAIVLTRNRPETLRRCVATALASLGTQDTLTIIDDSTPAISPANAALLAMKLSTSPPTCAHISTLRARELLTRTVSKSTPIWLSRTAPRDIAPLRNLSLLLSIVVPAETTILIDDDIHGFDLVATHHLISELVQSTRGAIAGADISGINEWDTITRLANAIDTLENQHPGTKAVTSREMFHVRGISPSGVGRDFKYVSAGYLAFRLPPERMFAFPPGYNEDWLWCLLHGGDPHVRILRSGEAVVHDPPSVRSPTREDFLFELLGDLVFDCLEEQHCGSDPEAALTGLSGRHPRPASMPSNRAQELIEKARSTNQNGGSLQLLEGYGLTVLEDMLLTGDLNIDWVRVLTDWSADAVEKHRSVAATLQDIGARAAINTLFQEGRL